MRIGFLASSLEPAESAETAGLGDGPCRVLVAAAVVEDAIDVLAAADEAEEDEGW